MTAHLAHTPYFNAVLQDDFCHADGEPWPCLHYRQNPPARCKCSHAGSIHTHGDFQCWVAMCGCSKFRPQEEKTA